jgi:hypothetical protein
LFLGSKCGRAIWNRSNKKMTETATSGQQAEDVEEGEIASERLENGNRPKHSAVQKRMDKLTRDKHGLRQENQGLRQENQELRDALQRYEATIRRYKQALMEAKKNARR